MLVTSGGPRESSAGVGTDVGGRSGLPETADPGSADGVAVARNAVVNLVLAIVRVRVRFGRNVLKAHRLISMALVQSEAGGSHGLVPHLAN